MNLASITIAGRVGNDPETRKVGDKTIVSFRVAVDKNRRNRDTNERETMWFTAESWNSESKQSENILKYVKKGNEIVVEGRFETNTYTKDGTLHTSLVVSVSNFQLPAREHNAISPKDAAPATAAAPAAAKTQTAAPAATPANSSNDSGSFEDDEIPF